MEWKIGKSSGRCAACDNELASGEAFFSVLLDGAEGLERRDYCRECWPKIENERREPRDEPIFFWRTVHEPAPKKRAIDIAMVTELFKKITDSDEEIHRKVRYFLALLLMRKKAVSLVRTGSDNGVEYMVIRVKGEDCERIVANPQLEAGELEDVKAELEAMIEMELSS